MYKIVNFYNVIGKDASLFFKNTCFDSEEEMRFVAIVPKCKLNDLSYTQNNGTMKKCMILGYAMVCLRRL